MICWWLQLGGNLAYRLPGGDKASHVEDYTLAAGYNAAPVFATIGSRNLSTVDFHLHYTYQKYALGAIVNHNLDGGAAPTVTLGGSCKCSAV